MESSILKYKPGMSSFYRIKYLVLSKEILSVYKSRWQAKMPHPVDAGQTITNIPLAIIKSCERVKVHVAKNKKKVTDNNNASNECYQFEIFLRDEYQDELT